VWIGTSTPNAGALLTHANAPLTPTGRLRLARCVVDDLWPSRRPAERFQMPVTCASRWAQRYRELREAGMGGSRAIRTTALGAPRTGGNSE
jgi:hypothetical protein